MHGGAQNPSPKKERHSNKFKVLHSVPHHACSDAHDTIPLVRKKRDKYNSNTVYRRRRRRRRGRAESVSHVTVTYTACNTHALRNFLHVYAAMTQGN